MRVTVVSAFPPTRDNYKAPTALPYQLLKFAPPDISVDLYFYNASGTPWSMVQESLANLPLNSYHQLEMSDDSSSTHAKVPFITLLLSRVRSKVLKVLKAEQQAPENNDQPPITGCFIPRNEVINTINQSRPDVVWLYSFWLLDWIPGLRNGKVVISGMDSTVLHSERSIRFGKWHHVDELKLLVAELETNLSMEGTIARSKTSVHMVGQADAERFNEIAGWDQAFFIPHPHYDYQTIQHSVLENNPIKIVITGGNQEVYLGDHLSRFISALINCGSEELKTGYHFSFIGSGYAPYVSLLEESNFSVGAAEWVDDFQKLLSEHQIQIFPIAVGTGTKGKVLTALASGLLGIGSRFAFENIMIDPPQDCCQYSQPEDIVPILLDILNNRNKYMLMAKSASEKIRQYHDPRLAAQLFWEKVRS